MIKVSIIIPVYNVDRYLEKCIISLINQELKEIEIILINDGSTDESLRICNQYAQQDKRIKVINKLNEGVSIARNEGIKMAQGEYIGFVDPDDTIESKMYKEMYNGAKQTHSEIVVCGFNVYKNGVASVKITTDIKEVLKEEEIHQQYLLPLISLKSLENNPLVSKRSVWQYLYRRELIIKNNIQFTEGLALGEDFIFNVETLGRAKKMCIIKEALYNYVIYEEGAAKRYRSNLSEINNQVRRQLRQSYELIYGKNKELEERINILQVTHLLGEIVNEVKSNEKNRIIKNKIRMLCSERKIKDILKEKSIYKNISVSQSIIYFLIKNKVTWLLLCLIKLKKMFGC